LFEEIVTPAALELARPEVKRRLAKRRKFMMMLAPWVRRWEEARAAGVRYRISQRSARLIVRTSSLDHAGDYLQLGVEMLGANIGALTCQPNGEIVFVANPGFLRGFGGSRGGRVLRQALDSWSHSSLRPLRWRGDDEDGAAIRQLLDAAHLIQRRRARQQPERVLWHKIFDAFTGAKTPRQGRGPAYPQLQSYTVVRPMGVAMQFPTVLGRQQVRESARKVPTGRADLLLRDGRRALFVAELKAPDGDEPAAALVQAIRYAVALRAEADDEDACECYRAVFKAAAGPLTFGAIAVLHECHEDAARRALDGLGAHDMRIGVLLYGTPRGPDDPVPPRSVRWLRRP